jgi:TonB family protein
MINKNKKSKLNLLRKMSIIPVMLIALYAFSVKAAVTPLTSTTETQPFSEITITEATMEVDTIPFVVVEEMPVFPGGDAELLKYIAENVRYPKNAMDNNIQGRVFVQFVVTAQGTIGEVRVLRGAEPELDAEAVRVIKTLPAFKPGKQGGVAVPVWYQTPITFQLRQTEQELVLTTRATETRSSDQPFVVVEEMPMFPGGDAELLRYIAENIQYPKNAHDNNIQGRVFVQFVVTAQGTIGETRILRGVDPELDAEAVRVIKTLPTFKPGRQGGVAVPVWYQTPITFQLR